MPENRLTVLLFRHSVRQLTRRSRGARHRLLVGGRRLRATTCTGTADWCRFAESKGAKIQGKSGQLRRAVVARSCAALPMKIFAYSVAHDLKSPSVGIYGLARLLHNNFAAILGAKGAGFCDNIMKASEHVASLVDSINLFISTKETPLKIEPIDMEEVFRMLRDEFSSRLTVRQICLFEPTAIPLVRADKIAVLRVFRNLIDNALKYGGDGLTTIEIGYEESDNLHHFTIRDDGVGIQANRQQRDIQAFSAAKRARRDRRHGPGACNRKRNSRTAQGEVWVERGTRVEQFSFEH